MGKRKERRLASKMGAGRRVKLDLLPEPPGDLGGSPANEAGGELESKLDGSLPRSPSSSGEQSVNPLLLLGQYSDDELRDESKEGTQDLDGNAAAATANEQLQNMRDEEHKEVGTSHDKEVANCNDGEPGVNTEIASGVPLQDAAINVSAESDVVVSPNSRQKNANILEGSTHLASDLHDNGDVKSCWKMVIHDESNSYYYWNTVTGETSWEMPAELVQVSSSYDGQNNQLPEKNEVRLGDAVAHNIMEYANGATQTSTGYDSGSQVTKTGDDNQLIGNLGVPGGANEENLILMNYSSFIPSDVPVAGWNSAAHVSSFYGPGSLSTNPDVSLASDLPAQLLKQSESLLEKLKSLAGSESNSNQQHAWASKYISEIEIRLSDFKSLLSFGSTLVPFWEHSQRQIRRLEDAVNSEIGSYVESELLNLPFVNEVREAGQEVKRTESQLDVDADLENIIKTNCDSLADDTSLFSDVPTSSLEELSSDVIISQKQVCVQAKEQSTPEATALPVSPKPEFDVQEDVDMDVDMEVEEASLPSEININVLRETPTHVNSSESMKTYPTDHQPSMVSAVSVLPPEEGEWVPPPPPDDEEVPPPPDDEEVPPPPPDEPPPPFPPSYHESMHTVSYTGNYTMTYQDPNYSFYMQHEAVMAGQPLYYQAVTTSLAEAIAGPANSIGTAAYYGLPDGGLPTMPVAAQSSGYQVSSAVSSYDLVSSERFETASGQSAVAYSNINDSESLLDIRPEAGTSPALSTSYLVTTPATTNVSASTTTAPATSASGAISTIGNAEVEAAAAAAKPQPKVSRVKRKSVTVASSLRSNKKVSSMVDKWMAAKEELEEADEEEARSALDLLEKKRQREIEEWRAQQIATGEARGNANFQPLGGDWRDRVKRRRAEKSAVSSSSKEQETCKGKLEQQPDLSELSSGLPHGWQVLWDASSRQVYYGNATTSETTWTRPTQ